MTGFFAATPIDRALPLLLAVVLLLAWVARRSRFGNAILLAVPLLLACELALPDERLRLTAIGLVMAAAFAATLAAVELDVVVGCAIAIAALAVLRIGVPLVPRELLIAAGAAAIVIAGSRVTPLTVTAAVAVGFFTPIDSNRAALFPLLVAALVLAGRMRFVFALPIAVALGGTAAVVSRPALIPIFAAAALAVLAQHIRQVALAAPALAAAFIALALFPWSGLVARALPFLLDRSEPNARHVIGYSLAAGEGREIDFPRGARSLIVTGSNISDLPPGTVLGRIEPGGVVLRVGDVADWGFLRAAQHLRSRNVVPRHPAGELREHGYRTWPVGSARIDVPVRARTLRVTADAALPPASRLQVDAIEWEWR